MQLRSSSPLPSTRDEARRIGAKIYFTGKPCKRGGVAERLVSSAECKCSFCDEARKSYREKNVSATKKRFSEYYENNKCRIIQRQRARYQENREEIIAQQRRYQKTNMAARVSYIRNYYRNNPDLYRRYLADRRASQLQRVPRWYGEFDQFCIQEASRLALMRDRKTGFKWHVDHMIPLKARNASGLHCGANIQVIPASMNLRKHNKMVLTEPGRWIKSL